MLAIASCLCLLLTAVVVAAAPAADVMNLHNLWGMEDALWQRIVRIVGILVSGYLVAIVLLAMIEKYRRLSAPPPEAPILDGSSKRIETVCAILRNATMVIVMVTTTFMMMGEIGLNIAPLLAGAGIAGIAIGFGAQSLVKDLFYGFFILLENQFGIGDVVQVGDSRGQVEQMTLRTITLRDLDGRVMIIPNGEINRVTVYTCEWSRMNLNLKVTYDTNLDKAYAVIEAAGKTFYKRNKDLVMEAPHVLGVEALEDSGVVIKVVAKTWPQKQWDTARAFRKVIKEAFDAEGIEIPRPAPVMQIGALPAKSQE
jgi:moderate conductance mechanosensitive channel